MPNMVIMCPKDENELRHMLYSASRYETATAVRYPRGQAVGVPMEPEFRQIPLGKWEMMREGSDVTLIGCGPVVYECMAAAHELEAEDGISCAVVNGRFAKPMDREMLAGFATQTKRILTLEENAVIGGFGSGVMEALSEEGISVPVKRIGLPDRFLPHSTQKALRKQVGLDKEGIKKTVKHWLKSE
jgi:1-deoxy-D-xylulose-5-phosphate synthase